LQIFVFLRQLGQVGNQLDPFLFSGVAHRPEPPRVKTVFLTKSKLLIILPILVSSMGILNGMNAHVKPDDS
jgi:hypothetical protein